ncbi:proposed homoserine kinase [Desulfofarcimen acetoxidans DSM 771]|uniref:Proposed homoserine kinase n=1 Tax=Desulfofarcimen acetoxidans (strain ATCC 49208 / DSM 771 / KCTC 5769 / VKM B-1644 / 5575) TaxID=485916 RepID=C8W6G2_DESAS|nr:cofactor-independent phosphoglycerate mutase [Desulfofarcimen acetoxidans]ACV62251.1 proposed homoserine kinase [Desulfofarcimen acetoxidans DSM 771]
MKYLILLGDGMADYKIPELGDKTPLQYAKTPHMDYLAANGEIGQVWTVPEGFPPGSDVANLSAMGYNPKTCYSGRSPLEAYSMGIIMSETDVSFRTNLVTLTEEPEEYEQKTILDHSSDEITTEEARELIGEIRKHLSTEELQFFAGISYRHLLIWKNGHLDIELTPPHDIPGRCIADYLPKGPHSRVLLEMMKKSYVLLNDHPVNRSRRRNNLRPANSIWFWGEGKKPSMENFYKKYGLKGSVISAVDLIMGLGKCAGMDVVKVEGATGGTHTNFRGKALAALEELKKGKDFVYIHVEAPDEAGHRGELDTKIKTIEEIDGQMLSVLLPGLEEFDDYKIMLLPDHPTPLAIRTHTKDPVPFAILRKGVKKQSNVTYCEEDAAKSGLKFAAGHELMNYFING